MTTHPHHLRAVPDHDPGRAAAQRFSALDSCATATGA